MHVNAASSVAWQLSCEEAAIEDTIFGSRILAGKTKVSISFPKSVLRLAYNMNVAQQK